MSETEERKQVIMEFLQRPLLSVYDYAVDEIVRLRDENAALRERAERAERILAALREPSETVTRVVRREWHLDTTPDDLVRFAVAAAEQEVRRE